MTTGQKELPVGWKWAKLRDVSSVITKGTTPTTLGFPYLNEGIPFLRALNVQGRAVEIDSVDHFIGDDAHQKMKRSHIFPGDLLITMAGTLGRIGYVANDSPVFNTNQDIAIVRLNGEMVDVEYACWVCQTPSLNESLLDMKSGATRLHLNLKQIGSFAIPLPPLEEQKRIAGILNKAEGLKKLREEADKKTEELIPAIFHEMFGDPASSRTKWSKTTLKDLAVKIVAGKSYSTDGDVESSPYKVLKTSAVSWRVFNHNEVKALPFDYVPPKEHIVQRDDILVSRMNTEALVGASVLVPKSYPDTAIPDRLWRVVVPKDVELVNAYLWGYLNYPSTRAKITSISSGTSGSMKNISQTNFLSLNLPIPPLEIQTVFGSRLASELQFSHEQQNSYNRIEELKSSLLQRAFRGEL